MNLSERLPFLSFQSDFSIYVHIIIKWSIQFRVKWNCEIPSGVNIGRFFLCQFYKYAIYNALWIISYNRQDILIPVFFQKFNLFFSGRPVHILYRTTYRLQRIGFFETGRQPWFFVSFVLTFVYCVLFINWCLISYSIVEHWLFA